jgi:hypothetical protein
MSGPRTLYQDNYSRAYNIWRDKCAEFRAEYAEDADSPFNAIVRIIIDTLSNNLSDNGADQAHPFHRYADFLLSINKNFEALRADVLHEVQLPSMRGYVSSFFHPSGFNFEPMLDLFKQYQLFAERAETEEWISSEPFDTSLINDENDDDDEDEDNDSETEEENDEDETEEENDEDEDNNDNNNAAAIGDPGNWGAITDDGDDDSIIDLTGEDNNSPTQFP